MTARQDIAGQLTHLNVLPTAARTATANGSAVDVRLRTGTALLILDCGAGGGTTPTLDVKIQDSADGSTGWNDISGATFTQLTTTAARQAISVGMDSCAGYIRAVSTIAGTSPTYTYSLNLASL